MNDKQGHDIPNVATLNVTDITNVKHLPDNNQGRVELDHSNYYKLDALIRQN